MDIDTILEEYISSEIIRKKAKISPETSLISSGLLDSLTLLQLIAFIEERFGIVVGDQEMAPENFQSINAMRTYIQHKLEAQ